MHLFAIKRLLNVGTRTPSALVYGQTGRYPLYIITYVKCIKYWLNLVRMPENRLPIKAYKMLYALHSKNKNNWVSHECFTLYRYGFGFVWENQGVCDVSNFIREFRQRLVDCFLQEWHSGIVSRDRLAFYSSFKQSHSLADYLCIIKKAVLRRNLIRFRLGVSPPKAHRLRYTDRSQGNYACPFCKDSDETEIHFLFVCPKYKTLRETYLLEKFYLRPSAFKWQCY